MPFPHGLQNWTVVENRAGEVLKWSNGLDSKTGIRATVPWFRQIGRIADRDPQSAPRRGACTGMCSIYATRVAGTSLTIIRPRASDKQIGEVPEWSNGLDSKSRVRATVPWVRIPPSPPPARRTPSSICRQRSKAREFEPTVINQRVRQIGAADLDARSAPAGRGAQRRVNPTLSAIKALHTPFQPPPARGFAPACAPRSDLLPYPGSDR